MTDEELRKLKWCGTPMLEEEDDMTFAPGALDRLHSAPRATQEEIRTLLALIRQAEAAVKAGQYVDILDALDALGIKPIAAEGS